MCFCWFSFIYIFYLFQAAIGGWHCLAVDDQGRAYAWGMEQEREKTMLLLIVIELLCSKLHDTFVNNALFVRGQVGMNMGSVGRSSREKKMAVGL